MSDKQHETAFARDKRLIVEQASEWFVKIHSDARTERDLIDHRAWMNANLMHYRAYRDLESVWARVGDFAERDEVQRLREEALQMIPAAADKTAKGNGKDFRLLPFAFAASLAVAVLGLAQVFHAAWKPTTESVYQTTVGEQRSLQLDDGSRLMLDTQTRLATDFSEQRREIVLEEGQARFDVAHDKSRPFVVKAGNSVITALGTIFTVRKNGDDVLVTLLDGKIEVVRELPAAPIKEQHREATFRTELHPGQQLAYSQDSISKVVEADITQVTAWERGRLVFENDPLHKVIDDLNRYSKRKIVLGDELLSSVRVTGVFKSGDNAKAIEALKNYFSMKVVTDANGNLILLSKDTAPPAG